MPSYSKYNQEHLVGADSPQLYTLLDLLREIGMDAGRSPQVACRALRDAGVTADAYIRQRHPQPGRADRYVAVWLDLQDGAGKLMEAMRGYAERHQPAAAKRRAPSPPEPEAPVPPMSARSQHVVGLTELSRRWRCSTPAVRLAMAEPDAPRRLPTSSASHPKWLRRAVEDYERRFMGAQSPPEH